MARGCTPSRTVLGLSAWLVAVAAATGCGGGNAEATAVDDALERGQDAGGAPTVQDEDAAAEPAPDGAEPAQQTGTGPIQIPDGAFDGTLDSMACLDLDHEGRIGDVKVISAQLELVHPAAGELVGAVISPSGNPYVLFSRPGADEDEVGASAAPGSLAAVVAHSTIELASEALWGKLPGAETMGTVGGEAVATVCAPYVTCRYLADRGGLIWYELADIYGETLSGTWKLCVGDAVTGNTGQLAGGSLTLYRTL